MLPKSKEWQAMQIALQKVVILFVLLALFGEVTMKMKVGNENTLC